MEVQFACGALCLKYLMRLSKVVADKFVSIVAQSQATLPLVCHLLCVCLALSCSAAALADTFVGTIAQSQVTLPMVHCLLCACLVLRCSAVAQVGSLLPIVAWMQLCN